MNAVNHALTKVFDLLLAPLDLLGKPWALILASGVFGVLALIAFKHISSQRRIKAAKDKIKAHLIEIRIYQDDLAIVGKAIGKILLRNFQYLGWNFGPFVPLAIPFVFVLAQFVVRYAFAPVAVHAATATLLPGQGTMLEVDLARAHAGAISGLAIEYPAGVRPLSPLVRVPAEGKAFQEVIATAAGVHQIQFNLADGSRETKLFVAGADARTLQPERGSGLFSALLWPAEDAFDKTSPFERIHFAYPDSNLGWCPGGTGGVLIVFVLASMAFGIAVLKPLGIEI